MRPTVEPTPRKLARLGWRKDQPDPRDHLLQLGAHGALPAQVDLRPQMPEVYDQGELGSCTANAIAGALEYDRMAQKLSKYVPSRLFIYYEERRIEGTTGSDAGAEIRDGLKVVAKLGAPDEALWPYNIAQFTQRPPASCYPAALEDQALSYARVTQSADALKQALAAGFPVVIGFVCYAALESDAVATSGVLPMPKKHEAQIGGHAVLLVGYDSKGRHFIARNSWGAAWGLSGYFLMPTAYVCDPQLASDFWTIRSVG